MINAKSITLTGEKPGDKLGLSSIPKSLSKQSTGSETPRIKSKSDLIKNNIKAKEPTKIKKFNSTMKSPIQNAFSYKLQEKENNKNQ